MGGSILERTTDGRVLPWAEVVVWRPPERVVLSWRPLSEPEPPTELEVTFALAKTARRSRSSTGDGAVVGGVPRGTV
jgi:hypothetical protein